MQYVNRYMAVRRIGTQSVMIWREIFIGIIECAKNIYIDNLVYLSNNIWHDAGKACFINAFITA